jgi:hypothetical protein
MSCALYRIDAWFFRLGIMIPRILLNTLTPARQSCGGFNQHKSREIRRKSRKAASGVEDAGAEAIFHPVIAQDLSAAGSAGEFVWTQSRSSESMDTPPQRGNPPTVRHIGTVLAHSAVALVSDSTTSPIRRQSQGGIGSDYDHNPIPSERARCWSSCRLSRSAP